MKSKLISIVVFAAIICNNFELGLSRSCYKPYHKERNYIVDHQDDDVWPGLKPVIPEDSPLRRKVLNSGAEEEKEKEKEKIPTETGYIPHRWKPIIPGDSPLRRKVLNSGAEEEEEKIPHETGYIPHRWETGRFHDKSPSEAPEEILKELDDAIYDEEKTHKYEILRYREQVVEGMNYCFKVGVNGHLSKILIYQNLKGEKSVIKYQKYASPFDESRRF